MSRCGTRNPVAATPVHSTEARRAGRTMTRRRQVKAHREEGETPGRVRTAHRHDDVDALRTVMITLRSLEGDLHFRRYRLDGRPRRVIGRARVPPPRRRRAESAGPGRSGHVECRPTIPAKGQEWSITAQRHVMLHSRARGAQAALNCRGTPAAPPVRRLSNTGPMGALGRERAAQVGTRPARSPPDPSPGRATGDPQAGADTALQEKAGAPPSTADHVRASRENGMAVDPGGDRLRRRGSRHDGCTRPSGKVRTTGSGAHRPSGRTAPSVPTGAFRRPRGIPSEDAATSSDATRRLVSEHSACD